MRISEIERRFNNLRLQETEPDVLRLQKLKEMVAQGLSLDRGMPSIRPEERASMVDAIATTVSDCTEILGIPLPNEFGLTYDWNKNRGVYKDTLAQVTIDERYPDGKIFFSPFYLYEQFYSLLKDILGGLYCHIETTSGGGRIVIQTGPIKDLKETTAHEVYHLWQARAYPDLFAKHSAIASSQKFSPEEWLNLRFERAAEMFSRVYFTERFKVQEPELVQEYISAASH